MTVHQYLRVSTQHQLQGDKLGLALQLTGMNDYCAKHNSGERVVVHSDEGISGSASIEKREGLFMAIAALEKGDTIIAYDRSRFARDTYVMMVIEKEVEKRGARIITVVGDNSQSPEGELLRTILTSIATYQRKSNNMKIKMALKEKSKTHKLGKAPYGYSHNSDRTEYIEVVEEQIVLKMVDAYRKEDQKDWGIFTRLACYLNENGVKRRTGTSWTRQSARATFHTHIIRSK